MDRMNRIGIKDLTLPYPAHPVHPCEFIRPQSKAFELSLKAMRYQKTLRLLLALLLLSSNAFAQSAAKPSAAPDAERLRAHVTYLASDKLEGRRTGMAGAQEAARYVARELARIGVQP